MRALPPCLCLFRTPPLVPIIIRHLPGRYDFNFEGVCMSLLAWFLCASLFDGGYEKDTAPVRRQLPLSAREAVSISLNHNLDIEVARYQPWIEDQNIFSAMGLWDHVAYATVSEARDVSPGVSALSGNVKPRNDDVAFTVGVRKLLPFGASYDFSFSTDRSESNNSFLLINP